jgi:hypothetical protein
MADVCKPSNGSAQTTVEDARGASALRETRTSEAIPMMTPVEFEKAIMKAGFKTHKQAWKGLGVTSATLYRYLKGTTPVPETVVKLIDLIIENNNWKQLSAPGDREQCTKGGRSPVLG